MRLKEAVTRMRESCDRRGSSYQIGVTALRRNNRLGYAEELQEEEEDQFNDRLVNKTDQIHVTRDFHVGPLVTRVLRPFANLNLNLRVPRQPIIVMPSDPR